jgi:8-oxo-dGTP pyrophosphatase MutT (NUDIX family)
MTAGGRSTLFAESYLGQLRAVIGDRLVLMPGTRIVIEDDAGRILIDHRADFRVWALPGGCAETGEALEQTIVREVLEESGLVLGAVTAFGFASDPDWETTTFPNGDRVQNFSLMFTTREFSGTPRPLDGEALDYRWCDPRDLPEMVPNHRRTVEAWLRWKAGEGFQLI